MSSDTVSLFLIEHGPAIPGRHELPGLQYLKFAGQEVGTEEGRRTDAIRIARPEEHSAGYRKTPDWKVVPGQAAAIPAPPPAGLVAETEGRHSTRADRWC